jgi:periplasmic protein TonB
MRRRVPASSSSYTLLVLREAPLDGTAFDRRGARAGAAAGTAVASHALVLLVILGLARLQPVLPDSPLATPSTAIGPFVFTGRLDDGSGRSGGGDRSTQPAAVARTRGADLHTVPAASPRSLATPNAIVSEREPAPALPVTPMDAGTVAQIGALDGVPGPPTDARGPGDTGVGTRMGRDRGLGGGPGDGIGDGPYGIGNGVTGPELIHRTPPQYSAEAMRAKLQGVAVLSGVVGIDGLLHDIRVVRSLDPAFGLDQEAIRCVRQWRFRPGTRQGKPVAVYVTIEVAFNLR